MTSIVHFEFQTLVVNTKPISVKILLSEITSKNLAQFIYSNRQTKLRSTIYKNMTQHRKLDWKNTTKIPSVFECKQKNGPLESQV